MSFELSNIASPCSVQFHRSTLTSPLTRSLPGPTVEKLSVCSPLEMGVIQVFARADHGRPTTSKGTESQRKRSVFVLRWITLGAPSNLSPSKNSRVTPCSPE